MRSLILSLALASGFGARGAAQSSTPPDTVVVSNGTLRLHALLWRPQGTGPFPAILFTHGGRISPEYAAAQTAALGAVFARHGYVFLYLFRRGSVLSADQGTSAGDLMAQELAARGQAARNRLQLRLLEGDDLSDAFAGLQFLRGLPEVDARRVAIAGHSFGGSLTLIMAERDSALRAVVTFAASANSWDHSSELRTRLRAAVGHAKAPIFFAQAANDYSIAPTRDLAAEMDRLGKPHGAKIYPAMGKTADEGHDFVHLRVSTWEPDVFDFLDRYLH